MNRVIFAALWTFIALTGQLPTEPGQLQAPLRIVSVPLDKEVD